MDQHETAAREPVRGKKLGAAFDRFLTTLAYPCIEETRNPVYQLFLR